MKILFEHKENNSVVHLFEIPIYDSKVCVVMYGNHGEYNRLISDIIEPWGLKLDDYNTDEYRNSYGFVQKEKTQVYGFVHFLFINNSDEYELAITNTLSHENFHLIQSICNHHGLVYYKNGNNEHIAYLTGYLYEYLNKIINN